MKENREDKQEAERQITDALANQPKQDGPGTEESKEERGKAENKLQSLRTPDDKNR
jgi:hypothetical protein